MFLNPCLYNISIKTIQTIINKFRFSKKEFATSVKKYKNWLWDNEGNPIIPMDYKSFNVETIPQYFEAVDGFHIFNKHLFFEFGKMLDKNLGLITLPKEETFVVCDEDDYQYARWKIVHK